MFTGIIETIGRVKNIQEQDSNLDFLISSGISHELKIDQSVNHNGVCLTVVELDEDWHKVTAVKETLEKSNLGQLKTGSSINLERAMISNGRFDGHIVQGHVDQVAHCSGIEESDGSWLFTFKYNADGGNNVVVEKGSICVNGISLTCFNVTEDHFTVAIIPYTYEHTNLGALSLGDGVNLEFDIIGKYVEKLLGSRLTT